MFHFPKVLLMKCMFLGFLMFPQECNSTSTSWVFFSLHSYIVFNKSTFIKTLRIYCCLVYADFSIEVNGI